MVESSQSRRTAKDIMTTPVHTVQSTDSLEKVIEVICRNCISGVPVVQGNKRLVGLISERDILNAMYSSGPSGPKKGSGQPGKGNLRNISKLVAEDVMVDDVVTAHPDTEFLRLASIMALQKVRRIPIVEGETLVGIVCYGDVGRAIFGQTGKATICPAMRSNSTPPSGKGS